MPRMPTEPAPDAPHPRLGAKLRALRKDARLNQPELADLLHVSHSYPSAWERGLYRPKAELLQAICAVLRAQGAVDADYDELAQLAGYAAYTPPPVATVPVDDPDKVPILRRLARLSPAALAKLEAVAQTFGLEGYNPEADAGTMGAGDR